MDKIDGDKDGFVSLVELKDWIRYTQKRYINEDVDRHWRQHNPNNDEVIPWEVREQHIFFFTRIETGMLCDVRLSLEILKIKKLNVQWFHTNQFPIGQKL